MGAILFGIIFSMVGVPGAGPVEILEVAPSSPAEQAGLQPGDLILQVQDTPIESSLILQEAILANLGQDTQLEIQRGERTFEVILVPRTNPPPNEGAIGIIMSTLGPMRSVSPAEAALLGSGMVVEQIRTLVTLPVRIVEGSIASEDARLVGYKGMFDIYQNLQETEVEAGTPAGVGTLFFAATITVSLGLLNLLPIPALDGGRILFSLPEILIRRRIPPAYESLINMVSLALLLLLIIYINVQDFVNPAQLR
jgi:regulator of sigma E protease